MVDENNDLKKNSKGSIADFFAKSPLRGSGLVVRRERYLPSKIDFDDPPEDGDHTLGPGPRPTSKK